MIMDKKTFFTGLSMLGAFLAVLFILFMPIFGGGQNALNYLDNLYNSISKGSAYYIEDLQSKNNHNLGREVDVTITLDSLPLVENTSALFAKAGATTRPTLHLYYTRQLAASQHKTSGPVGPAVRKWCWLAVSAQLTAC